MLSGAMLMGEWVAFWDSEHAIYVNARHRDVHYRTIAEHIRAQLASLQASPAAVVLDYGCGEALHAELVAQAVGRLTLVEAAPKVRAGLAARFADNPKIAVRAPEDLAAEPDASYDVIVMHSVAQYLTPVELDGLLAQFRRLLKPNGHLILGDILPPDIPAWIDAMALIRFARANGFLVAALAGLVRTVLSDYWRLRSRIGLTRYDETAMIRKLAAAGFAAIRARDNIGHNRARMTFVARPV
jgi:SAM-dependent methyltransferase